MLAVGVQQLKDQVSTLRQTSRQELEKTNTTLQNALAEAQAEISSLRNRTNELERELLEAKRTQLRKIEKVSDCAVRCPSMTFLLVIYAAVCLNESIAAGSKNGRI